MYHYLIQVLLTVIQTMGKLAIQIMVLDAIIQTNFTFALQVTK
jgi:hypothetical protein